PAASTAAARPMPLTATRVPSPVSNSPSRRRVIGLKLRASMSSAATTPAPLNALCSMCGSAAAERAEDGERPQRKIPAVAVILEIKDPRKTGRGERRITPQAVGPLRPQQVIDAPAYGLRAHLPGRHERQHGPCRLIRRARRLYERARI